MLFKSLLSRHACQREIIYKSLYCRRECLWSSSLSLRSVCDHVHPHYEQHDGHDTVSNYHLLQYMPLDHLAAHRECMVDDTEERLDNAVNVMLDMVSF